METAPEAEPIAAVIARRLRVLREEQRMSVRDVSAELGYIGYRLLPSGVSKIENRERQVSAEDLLALSIALGVSPAELLIDPKAPGIKVTPAVDVLPYDLLVWLWGKRGLQGRQQPPEWADTIRAAEDSWLRVQTPGHDAAKTAERWNHFLRRSVELMREQGIRVPDDIARYVDEHPRD